ncbi:MAG: DNA replication/repair protein RecF [Coriobacteriia bacterium]|nr:DNA replication/repair protein RecF [Coriobacteriia bacterium]
MSLVLRHLLLKNFRSYSEFQIVPGTDITLLTGPNAAGKTNIIESLQLLTAAESFRKPQGNELIRWGETYALAEMKAEGGGRSLDIRMEVRESRRKEYYINGKKRRRTIDVAGIIPCVVFTPDDLKMVKDSADKRRETLDGVGDQLSITYRARRVEYERIVRQRNLLLRDPSTQAEVLAVWTNQLIEKGAAFSGHRKRLFDRIVAHMTEIYTSLTVGEDLQAFYQRAWLKDIENSSKIDQEEQIRNEISRRVSEEKSRGMSLVGPHRDEIIFTLNGRDARVFASQGQQRTIALSWKLAEVMAIKEITSQPPILLLDDVMSELDEQRRYALTESIKEVQTFITTTNLGYFDESLIQRAEVISLP